MPPFLVSLWDRYSPKPSYRRPAIAFAGSLFFVCLIGNLLISPPYRASTLIALSKEEIQDEWDLLKNETQGVDLEEQAESRAVLEPVLNKLGLLAPKASPQALTRSLERFRKNLVVERVKHSNILRITYTSPDPVQAATGANAVAESFLQYFRDRTTSHAERYLLALEKELEEVLSRLNTQTQLYDQFLSTHQLNSYEAELQRVQQRVATLQLTLRSIEMGNPTDDPSLQESFKQVAAAEARLIREKSRFKPGSPVLLQAEGEKEDLEQIFRKQLNERRQNLENLLKLEEDRFNDLREIGPQIQLREALIAHEKRRHQDLLAEQSKTHLLLTLSKQLSPTPAFGNFSILDEALPPPSRSRWARFLLNQLGAACLSLLGLVLAPVLIRQWESKFRQIDSLVRTSSNNDPRSVPVPADPGVDVTHEVHSSRIN